MMSTGVLMSSAETEATTLASLSGSSDVSRVLHIVSLLGRQFATEIADQKARWVHPEKVTLTRAQDGTETAACSDVLLLAGPEAAQNPALDVVTGCVAPEVFSGKADPAASTVYHLAALAYHVLTKEMPFSGGNPAAIRIKVLLERPKAPRSLCPHLPESLEKLLLSALDKQVAARPSLPAFCDTLDQLAKEAPVPSPSPPSAEYARGLAPPAPKSTTETHASHTVPPAPTPSVQEASPQTAAPLAQPPTRRAGKSAALVALLATFVALTVGGLALLRDPSDLSTSLPAPPPPPAPSPSPSPLVARQISTPPATERVDGRTRVSVPSDAPLSRSQPSPQTGTSPAPTTIEFQPEVKTGQKRGKKRSAKPQTNARPPMASPQPSAPIITRGASLNDNEDDLIIPQTADSSVHLKQTGTQAGRTAKPLGAVPEKPTPQKPRSDTNGKNAVGERERTPDRTKNKDKNKDKDTDKDTDREDDHDSRRRTVEPAKSTPPKPPEQPPQLDAPAVAMAPGAPARSPAVAPIPTAATTKPKKLFAAVALLAVALFAAVAALGLMWIMRRDQQIVLQTAKTQTKDRGDDAPKEAQTEEPKNPKGAVDPFPVGDYTCFERLGEGGMGMVYKARHNNMDREAAIKVLSPAAMISPGAIELFEREATLSSQINHPNSVFIYDYGNVGGALFYLVMEFIDGKSLDEIISPKGTSPRPLPLQRVLTITKQICSVLETAHNQGIVHRDAYTFSILCFDVPDKGV